MKKQHLWFIPAILCMGLIFYLSHQPGQASSQLSGGLLDSITSFINTLTPVNDPEIYHTLLRKSAHFMVYFTLGGFLYLGALKNKMVHPYRFSFGLCVVFAISDEYHQSFIEGRAGQVKDVCIDSSGALVGLMLIGMITYIWHRKRT